jgi:aspartyl aminopeptidase
MGEAVQRIASALNGDDGNLDLYQACLRRSFILSVDQAHAVHPNYASKHEKGHQPKMNGGMVIKRNSNQRYATNGITGFLVRELAKKAGLPPVQEFVVRNDCACGSTIGPIISTATGIRAVDMGCPQLSMHSIRETMGVCDCTYCSSSCDGTTYAPQKNASVLFSYCMLYLFRSLAFSVTNGLALFKAFYQHFREVDASVQQ